MADPGFIWTLNGPVPANYWLGNRLMMPSFQQPARNQSPIQTSLAPQIDQSGLLQTGGLSLPGYIGSDGGRGSSRGDGGPDLGRGPADIGYSKGEATADTTTTATNSSKDFAMALAAGLAGPLPAAAHTMTGKGILGNLKDAALGLLGNPNDLSGSIGQNPVGVANPGVSLVGQANDPFGGGTGLGQGPTQPGVDLIGQANDPFGGATGLGQGGDQGTAK